MKNTEKDQKERAVLVQMQDVMKQQSGMDDNEKLLLQSPNVLKKQEESQQKKNMEVIAAVIAFYWIVSLAVVFLNKFILSSSETKFPYPLLVTFYQLIIALILLVVLGNLSQQTVSSSSTKHQKLLLSVFAVIPPFEFQPKIVIKILPLSLAYVLMLAFNNMCLSYVEVTFYQIARSLTIPFNILLTYTILKVPTSKQALISCSIVIMGFLIGSWGEVNFSFVGLVYGVASSVFVALYGILVKSSLVHVENNQWRLLHYNTAISIPLMIPFIVGSGEISSAYEYVYFWTDVSFWLMMTFTGITGFLINIAVFLQIKYTTPLTNTISGTAKACFQTFLAWFIFRNPISALNAFGLMFSLFGSFLYSYVRYLEMKTNNTGRK